MDIADPTDRHQGQQRDPYQYCFRDIKSNTNFKNKKQKTMINNGTDKLTNEEGVKDGSLLCYRQRSWNHKNQKIAKIKSITYNHGVK